MTCRVRWISTTPSLAPEWNNSRHVRFCLAGSSSSILFHKAPYIDFLSFPISLPCAQISYLRSHPGLGISLWKKIQAEYLGVCSEDAATLVMWTLYMMAVSCTVHIPFQERLVAPGAGVAVCRQLSTVSPCRDHLSCREPPCLWSTPGLTWRYKDPAILFQPQTALQGYSCCRDPGG